MGLLDTLTQIVNAASQNSQPQHGSVQLDIGSGTLIADADGKSWVMLRARTTGNAFDMKLPLQVADLLQASRAQAGEQGERQQCAACRDGKRLHNGGPMLICSLKPEFSRSWTGIAISTRICPTGDNQRTPIPALW